MKYQHIDKTQDVGSDTGKQVTNPKVPIEHVAEVTIEYWVSHVQALQVRNAS